MMGNPTFDDLVAIMARLRGPAGCPWDREQTHRSLRPYLLEETYEALDAIDAGSAAQLCQELGDLLLQVVFHAQMASEAGTFTVDDVVAGLVEKLIRRHPHVFGDLKVGGSEDVLTNWESIKARERTAGLHTSGAGPRGSEGALDGLPRSLPALALAQRMQDRAARAGFAWPDRREAIGRVREALEEMEASAGARDQPDAAGKLGEVLFAVANLARSLNLDGEQALRETCAAFRARFARLEAAAREQGRAIPELGPDELLAMWRAAR